MVLCWGKPHHSQLANLVNRVWRIISSWVRQLIELIKVSAWMKLSRRVAKTGNGNFANNYGSWATLAAHPVCVCDRTKRCSIYRFGARPNLGVCGGGQWAETLIMLLAQHWGEIKGVASQRRFRDRLCSSSVYGLRLHFQLVSSSRWVRQSNCGSLFQWDIHTSALGKNVGIVQLSLKSCLELNIFISVLVE